MFSPASKAYGCQRSVVAMHVSSEHPDVCGRPRTFSYWCGGKSLSGGVSVLCKMCPGILLAGLWLKGKLVKEVH